MVKQWLGGFLGVTACCGFLVVVSTASVEDAYAKPPDWAPAHGYRNKHEGDGEKSWKHQQKTETDDGQPYYWTFSRLDANNDGRISLREWNEDKALFVILDANHDGYISRTEYVRIDEERGLLSGLVASVKEKTIGLWNWLF